MTHSLNISTKYRISKQYIIKEILSRRKPAFSVTWFSCGIISVLECHACCSLHGRISHVTACKRNCLKKHGGWGWCVAGLELNALRVPLMKSGGGEGWLTTDGRLCHKHDMPIDHRLESNTFPHYICSLLWQETDALFLSRFSFVLWGSELKFELIDDILNPFSPYHTECMCLC